MPDEPPVIVRPPDEEPPIMQEVCQTVNPGDAPMMRLTEYEYQGAVDAIFPTLDITYAARVKDEKVGPFDANVSVPVETLQTEHYQDNAERVADEVVTQMAQLLPCATSTEEQLERIEAESLMGTVGQASNDSWLLWSNGEVATTVTIEHAGTHEIAVRAWGSQAGQDLPKMHVLIDRAEVQVFEVEALNASPQVYRTELNLEEGAHELVVQFSNDYNEEGADRNLWVDYMEVTAKALTTIDDACIQDFVEDFGKRAWRRPLTTIELDRFKGLFDAVRDEQGAKEGFRAVVEAGLQSPNFIYRTEFEQDANEPVVKLGDYEMASRLSFFLWDAGPDDALLNAAAAGELQSSAQVEAQARRMMEDPRARKVVNRAVAQMLGLDKLSEYNKEDERYTPEVRQGLYDEALYLIDHILWEEGGDLEALLTAEYAFVSKTTAWVYGVSLAQGAGENGEIVKVDMNGRRHGGLLTHPAVLARHGYGQMNVHRGLFIREFFFCDRPSPPPDELVNPPETFDGQSDRSKGEGRLANNGCAYCHQHMEGIGNAFDNFDAIGKERGEDRFGNPVTDEGELLHTLADDQEYKGASALAGIMAQSSQVEACVSSQWLRYAMGRYLNAQDDACTVKVIEEAAADADGNIVEMFLAITTTDAFRYIRTTEAQ